MSEDFVRPTHPDFERMVAAVVENDKINDEGASETVLDDLFASLGIADMDSVIYMSHQRMMRAVRHNFMSPESAAVLGMIWVDGLAAGLRMAKNEHEAAEQARIDHESGDDL